ncbi:hypothetical protein EXIGLDRAFT_721507 [Exidia glandulosa HHB12029]|uniref:Uncharacterized protein n=1 Tax=Exidia glandulosa HHB12029 TaxID=1314781 RepID=A0A165FPJ2_EXIGL|nr:hypothetical protein EXIGLDRAFT_721507 [Exidia glandulosa HHB12029]
MAIPARQRTVSTSRPGAKPTINRVRTGSVYSLSSVTQSHGGHQLRPQSPVRSVVSAGPRYHYSSPPNGLSPSIAHSPPTSVLSLQSTSTSSMTSASTSSPISPKLGPVIRAKVTAREASPARLTLPLSDDSASDIDEEDEDDKASTKSGASSLDPALEAKTNRKIADLEITNASLLSINASLEALKVRQQKEIWELRRKLRETRLALPPPVFASLKDKDEPVAALEEEEEDDEPEPDPDPMFERLNAIVQGLLDDAREAVAASVAPVKVLSAHEVLAWEGRRKSAGGEDDDDEDADAKDEREVTVMLDRTPSPP